MKPNTKPCAGAEAVRIMVQYPPRTVVLYTGINKGPQKPVPKHIPGAREVVAKGEGYMCLVGKPADLGWERGWGGGDGAQRALWAGEERVLGVRGKHRGRG